MAIISVQLYYVNRCIPLIKLITWRKKKAILICWFITHVRHLPNVSLKYKKQEFSSQQLLIWATVWSHHNRHGPKIGGCCAPIRGEELCPYLPECRLGRGLPPHQVASWSTQPFGHNTPTSQTDRQTDRQLGQWLCSTGRTITCSGRPNLCKQELNSRWDGLPWP